MSKATRLLRSQRKAEIQDEIRARQSAQKAIPPKEEGDYLFSKGWVCFRGRWIDGRVFAEDGFFSSDMSFENARCVQRVRDEEDILSTLEGQRTMLLGVLSSRKRGPVPLERARAGFLFLLERRAIRLIETE